MHRLNVGRSYYASVASMLNESARYLSYKDFTPSKQALTCYFSNKQVKDIELLKADSSVSITKAQIKSVINAKKDPVGSAGILGD
jgi:hypothetical protein